VDEFRLLGPLETVVDGNPVSLAAAKPRALLALLLLNRNRVVSTERLIDELWADEPPSRATKTLQVYVSQLRKVLGPERLVTQPTGYMLRVAAGELDLDRFEELTAAALKRLEEDDAVAASEQLREALQLWRGSPEPVAAHLTELRITAQEDFASAALEAGEGASVIPELERLVDAEPLRERPRELLMLALYRAGRQADALELFRRTRELFVGELGIEPSAALRDLEGAMLRHDPALDAPPRTRSSKPTQSGNRRTLVLASVVAAAVVLAVVAALLASNGGGGTHATTPKTDAQLRAFVFKLENFLAQSHDGRVAVGRALAGALDCSLSPQVAAAQLDGVQQNRQSLLQQLAALQVPPGDEALRASDLLQRASHASIAADWIYRDWLRSRTTCVPGRRLPAAAARASTRASALKRQFLVAFDPLARRYGRRIWRADQF
jgi:DNA-binding SARP family transcriptional activator